jgi:predicted DNA-binding protein (MmcQ/YjbR family)
MNRHSETKRNTSKETPLARIRRICLTLPHTHEQKAWSAPTFRVHGKMFVMFMDNHHEDSRLAIWCNAPPGVQQLQVASEPKCFFIPRYVGSRGWVGIRLDMGLDWDVIAQFIKDAYDTTMNRTR